MEGSPYINHHLVKKHNMSSIVQKTYEHYTPYL